MVAHHADIAAAQLSQREKAHQASSIFAVGANEPVVLATKMVEALKRTVQLEGALGRKTLENEILKEPVEHGNVRQWIARSPLRQGDEQSELFALLLVYRSAMSLLLQNHRPRSRTKRGELGKALIFYLTYL